MNQILSTDINKDRKKKSPASIHTIVIIFCMFLLIFGIGTTATGAYSYYNILTKKSTDHLLIANNTKPYITIERQNASTANIVVSHDKEIDTITYSINDEDEIEFNGNKRINVVEKITLKAGANHIIVKAKDINGISSTYEADMEVAEGPVITSIPLNNDGKVKVVTESEAKIDKIIYYWDDDKEHAVELTINDFKNETLIDVSLEGMHTLYIEAIDVEGRKTVKDPQRIIGVNKPTVEVTTDGQNFYITAKDSQGLSKIEITHNTNETITETVEGNEYRKTIPLENGENRLTVNAYNKNDKSNTSKVKYTK